MTFSSLSVPCLQWPSKIHSNHSTPTAIIDPEKELYLVNSDLPLFSTSVLLALLFTRTHCSYTISSGPFSQLLPYPQYPSCLHILPHLTLISESIHYLCFYQYSIISLVPQSMHCKLVKKKKSWIDPTISLFQASTHAAGKYTLEKTGSSNKSRIADLNWLFSAAPILPH